MRKLKVALLGGMLIAGVLGGPAAATVAAQPATPDATYAGWTCHPDGSGTNGATTTLSFAALYEDSSKDYITCLFRGYAPRSVVSFDFGGDCYFDIPGPIFTQFARIEFSHRTWIVQNGSAKLFCWDGEFVGD